MKNVYLIIVIAPVILLMPSAIFADDDPYAIHMTAGDAAFSGNKYESAATHFREALALKPEDFDALMGLGAALNAMGDEEAGSVLKQALFINPESSKVNLELGRYFLRKEIYSEAEEFLNASVEFAAGPEEAAPARTLLAGTPKEDKGKKAWAAYVQAGLQHDSNVIVKSEDSPLPQGISNKSDWRGVIVGAFNYKFVDSRTSSAGITYSLYQSLHFELSEYNVTSQTLKLDGSHRLSKTFEVGAAYYFDYVILDGDGYSSAHNVNPVFTINEGGGFRTDLTYRYKKNSFEDSAKYPNNSDRSGDNQKIALEQAIPISSSAKAGIGAEYEKESTDSAAYEFTGAGGNASFQFSLPLEMDAGLGIGYSKRDYEIAREDESMEYSIELSKDISDSISASLRYIYVDNDSNIVGYKYKRAITGIMVSARF